jgi:hypothetical protein
MTCFFARFSDEPCDGPTDKAHLIPKQRIKREVSDDPRLVWHPSVWVHACRRHHADFDNHVFRIARSDLPAVTEAAAKVLGMEWSLVSDYGPRDERAVG